jgi:hypothetical protein
MKQAVRAGTADPAAVIDDTISLLRSEADMLRQQQQSDGAAAATGGGGGSGTPTASRSAAAAAKAADDALALFERKAARMKAAVAEGKMEGGAAVEEVFAGLTVATDEVLQAAAVADLDASLAEVTGGLLRGTLGCMVVFAHQ